MQLDKATEDRPTLLERLEMSEGVNLSLLKILQMTSMTEPVLLQRLEMMETTNLINQGTNSPEPTMRFPKLTRWTNKIKETNKFWKMNPLNTWMTSLIA